jgi:hypothetical protein
MPDKTEKVFLDKRDLRVRMGRKIPALKRVIASNNKTGMCHCPGQSEYSAFF